jgi:hypothetical protein
MSNIPVKALPSVAGAAGLPAAPYLQRRACAQYSHIEAGQSLT